MANPVMTELPALPAGTEKFLALVQRCNADKPRRRDITRLQKALRELPDLWKATGDLAHCAAQATIDKNLSASPLMMESVKAGHIATRKELGYETAPPLEKMLAEHIALCWLRLQIAELKYNRATNEDNVTYERANHWDRRLAAAQRRYLHACEALARIRRMNLPVVQVNVGEKQINVATP